MYIALTGTPGTGKSGAAKLLAERGFTIRTVEELARQHAAIEEIGGDLEVDTEKLALALKDLDDTIIIEGHLAHYLPNVVCIILRCHPEVLRKRLQCRNYSREKLLANMEAEPMYIRLAGALEMWENVCEFYTTELAP